MSGRALHEARAAGWREGYERGFSEGVRLGFERAAELAERDRDHEPRALPLARLALKHRLSVDEDGFDPPTRVEEHEGRRPGSNGGAR